MPNSQGVNDSIDHRFKIAIKVLTWSSIGLTGLAVVVILAAVIVSVKANKPDILQETTKYVFTALLPLLGTWVGTVLAFYFSTKNFQAASDSVRETIKETQKGRLETHLAGDTMLSYDKIKGVEIDDSQKEDALKIKLEENFLNILSRKYTRIPIFNKKQLILYVLHGSVIYEFFSEIQSDDPVTIVKKDATLEDLLKYRDEKYKKLITETFAIVGKNQTLAYAKSLMDKISKDTGEACQDVFVTETGNKGEPVLGWLTDRRIERYSHLEG